MANIFFTILPLVLTFTVAAWIPQSAGATNKTEPSSAPVCSIC